jgi:hypothetical protein
VERSQTTGVSGRKHGGEIDESAWFVVGFQVKSKWVWNLWSGSNGEGVGTTCISFAGVREFVRAGFVG